MTKNQHFPARYMHVTNNNHHLGDEEAIRLLMDECSYYPNNVLLNNFGTIRWRWSKEDVHDLLIRFFRQVKDIHLHSVGHDHADYASVVFTCCFSSPTLSSVFFDLDIEVADQVTSILTSQHPKLTQPILKKLGILKFDNKKPCKCKELIKLLSCQTTLHELELHGTLSDDSDLLASIIAIVCNPNFCRLSLDRVEVSLNFITKLLATYLATSPSHSQEVALHSVQVSNIEPDKGQQLTMKSSSAESALEYKSLQWTHSEWQVEFPKYVFDWLLSSQPLVLNNLFIDLGRLHFAKVTSNMLEIIASNAGFNVQNLKLNEDRLALSEEHLEAILKRTSLRSLELGSSIESQDLILLANALHVQIQLGTLESLGIDVYVRNDFDIDSILDVIFTLPQVSRLSLKLDVLWMKGTCSSKMVESIYQCWHKNGRKKLRKLCIRYGEGYSGFGTVQHTMDTHEMQLAIQ